MNPAPEVHHSEAGLLYRLRRGAAGAPLICLLHGLSGDENVMWIFEPTLPRTATLVAPRALYANDLDGYSWTHAVDHHNLDEVDFQAALDHLSRFLGEVLTMQQSNPRQVILMGFSQGAALSYAYSLRQPEALRGVIALAGFLPYPSAAPLLHSMPQTLPGYLIVHGTEDEAVPVARARAARALLQSYGASVEYHEHRVGHRVSAQGMKEIAQWTAKTLREA